MMMTRLHAMLGVSLLGAACATTEENDRFDPPDRPLLYRSASEPCPPPKPRQSRVRTIGKKPKLPTLAGDLISGAAAVAHAGVGSSPDLSDGPLGATKVALEKLAAGAPALDAAIAGTVVLEDD